MPIRPEHPRFKGITLPPAGGVLALLLVVYILFGLVGHDPWKHDDAISIGIVRDMVTRGHWLVPHLADAAYPDAPFYYWLASLTARLTDWLLPFHDAARLASGICTLLALEFILLATRELHGKALAAAGPLTLAGSIGFLFHAHEAQPMLAALTATTAAYWGLTLFPRRSTLAVVVLGCAAAVAFLANGVLPLVALIPPTLITLGLSDTRGRTAQHLILAITLAALICALWLIPLYLIAPDALATFVAEETAGMIRPLSLTNIGRHLNLLLWYAWPALPLAAWSIWSQRRLLHTRALALPLITFVILLLLFGLFVPVRSAKALLLLPPLVLLAVPGIPALRRGAANAFDWFGMMTFTLFAAIAWIGWSALVFGWPARLARQAVRLEPGFVGHFSLTACLVALAATLLWFWLIITSPRSPMRGITHWMAGLTLFWLLIVTLWMPWINYGKSYRPLSAALAPMVAHHNGCIANGNLPISIRAMFDYFDGIQTVPLASTAGKTCSHLLLMGEIRDAAGLAAAGWEKRWEGRRPGDRREDDKIRLYTRNNRAPASAPPIDLPAPADDERKQEPDAR